MHHIQHMNPPIASDRLPIRKQLTFVGKMMSFNTLLQYG